MRYTARGENAKYLCYGKAIVGWSIGLFALIGMSIEGDEAVGILIFIVAAGWGSLKYFKAKRIEKALTPSYSNFQSPSKNDYRKLEMLQNYISSEEFKTTFNEYSPVINLISTKDVSRENSVIKEKEIHWKCEPGDYIKLLVPINRYADYNLEFNKMQVGDELLLRRFYSNKDAPNSIEVLWNNICFSFLPVMYINFLSPHILDPYGLDKFQGTIIDIKMATNNRIESVTAGCFIPPIDYLEFYRDHIAVDDYWDSMERNIGKSVQ